VRQINTLAQYALMIFLACSAAACATTPEASSPMPLGLRAAPPQGFIAFCQREPAECGGAFAAVRLTPAAAESAPELAAAEAAEAVSAIQPHWSALLRTAPAAHAAPPAAAIEAALAPEAVELTPKLWATLTSVNDRINRAIARKADIEAYGVDEFWSLPLQAGVGFGDCEDYVLEKRRALLAAGVRRDALSIAVVVTPKGERHAVLLVETASGAYALDNLTPYILPWSKTGYRWLQRQVAGSSTRWALPASGAEPATSAGAEPPLPTRLG